MSNSRWKASTVPVTGSGEVGSGPQAAKTIIWLLLGVRSRPSANNNNPLINQGSESKRAVRGSKNVYLLLCCVGGYERFRPMFHLGVRTSEGLGVTTKSASWPFVLSHAQTQTNCQTVKEATGGISHCHCHHPPPHTTVAM